MVIIVGVYLVGVVMLCLSLTCWLHYLSTNFIFVSSGLINVGFPQVLRTSPTRFTQRPGKKRLWRYLSLWRLCCKDLSHMNIRRSLFQGMKMIPVEPSGIFPLVREDLLAAGRATPGRQHQARQRRNGEAIVSGRTTPGKRYSQTKTEKKRKKCWKGASCNITFFPADLSPTHEVPYKIPVNSFARALRGKEEERGFPKWYF